MRTICNTDVVEGTYSGACAAAILKYIGVPADVSEKFATAGAVAFTAHGPSILFVHAGEAWPEGECHTQEHRTSRGMVFLNRGWGKPAAALADWPACVERPVATPAPQPHSGDAPECAAAALTPRPAAAAVATAPQDKPLEDMATAVSEVLGRHGAPAEVMAAIMAAMAAIPPTTAATPTAMTVAGEATVIADAPSGAVTAPSSEAASTTNGVPEGAPAAPDTGGIEDLVEEALEEAPKTVPVRTLVPSWVSADSLEDPGLFEPASPEAKKEVRRLQQYLRVTRDASVRREIIETIARLEGKAK